MFICTGCKKEYEKQINFCSECGRRVERKSEITQYFCRRCQKKFDTPVKFCSECGENILNETAPHSQTIKNNPDEAFFPGIMSPTASLPQTACNNQTENKLNIANGGITLIYLFFICSGISAGILANSGGLIIAASIAFIVLWIIHIIKTVRQNSTGKLLLLIFLPLIGIIVSGFTSD